MPILTELAMLENRPDRTITHVRLRRPATGEECSALVDERHVIKTAAQTLTRELLFGKDRKLVLLVLEGAEPALETVVAE